MASNRDSNAPQDVRQVSSFRRLLRNLGRMTVGVRFLLLLCVFWVGALIYKSLNHELRIPQPYDTPVWIAGDWIVGEYRTCQLRTTTLIAGSVPSPEARAELPRLFCGRNDLVNGPDSLVQFQDAIPDATGATNALSGRGDWRAFDSYFHVLPVRYNGRIERSDMLYDSWRCQRNSASLTCWALN